MMVILRWTAFLAILAAAAILVLRLLFPLPSIAGRSDSAASAVAADTMLGQALDDAVAAHAGLSGVVPLASGVDAFVARAVLARTAERTIDAQYYIWQDDLTGLRLLSDLQDAAARGVRVRLLVDDNGTPALDQELAALHALPTAEVRLFNPFTLRKARWFNFTFDFFRLNRRMHNKSFTADGVVTVVGGRNIGDVYFETGEAYQYIDLDVLATGPAARAVSEDFQRYWTSGSAFDIDTLVTALPDAAGRLAERAAAHRDTERGRNYRDALHASDLADKIRANTVAWDWVPVTLFSDDPAKGLGSVAPEDLLIRQLMDEIGTPERSFDLISAYLVPGARGTDTIVDMARGGVLVRTLTNALEATDVVPVHAGYAAHRAELVDGGVAVYELRSETGARRDIGDFDITSISKAALHAKSLSVDRRRAFIGSFNFDPRSKHLNSEMGLLIDSPAIAGGLSDWLDGALPEFAYSVTRDDGDLVWTALDGTVQTRHPTEPNASAPLRAIVWLIGFLPIEWLL